tara:strand:- start:4003 stop:5175 length:1173 start_codon:yes stop_codon:yes gene_type:complete
MNEYLHKINEILINNNYIKNQYKFNIENRKNIIKEKENLSYKYFYSKLNIEKKKFINNYNKGKYNKNINTEFIDYIKKYYNDNYFDINNIYNNSFISLDIKYYIEQQIKYKYSYENDKLDIIIYSNNIVDSYYMSNIINIINFIKIIFNKDNKIKLIIYLTPLKKELNNDYLSCQEINSGSTLRNTIITIWRIEELEKVLIHELIHYLGLDIGHDNLVSTKLRDKLKLNINSVLNPNEAFTETFAIILYIYYITQNTNTLDIIKYQNEFNKQLLWSLYQSAKIIVFFKCFNELKDILNKEFNCQITQYTSVISYFIIKTSFIFKINNFFNFLKEINYNNYFDNTSYNLNKYFEFIINSLGNKSFNEKINKNIFLIKNKKLRNYKSMRMTI